MKNHPAFAGGMVYYSKKQLNGLPTFTGRLVGAK